MSNLLAILLWNIALTALMAAAVAVASQTRRLRDRPAVRHCLWLLILCKLATPPLIPWPVSAQHPAAAKFIARMAPISSTADAAIRDSDDRFNARRLDVSYSVADEQMQAAPTRATVAVHAREDDERSVRATQAFDGTAVLTIISLAVTVALAARLVIQWRRVSRLLRRGDWGSREVNAICRREAQRMGVRPVPQGCVVCSTITPLLWVRPSRPVVVLPKSLLASLTDQQIACVVRHELAHYARRDHWSNAVACLVGCLFWWNPIVWHARRELRLAQEACCDAIVVSDAPANRRTYAETLLQVIEFVGREAAVPQVTANFGERSSLTRRFEMI
ncbi:MAG: M56 family metallopeptidase, partial [Planctomycetota bacterium]